MRFLFGGFDRKSVWDILAPYLLTILLLMCVFLASLTISRQMIFQSREKLISDSISSISQTSNNRINRYRKICDVLAASNDLIQYAKTDRAVDKEALAAVLQQGMTNMISVANVSINSILIYTPSNHSIVTPEDRIYGSRSCDTYMQEVTDGVFSIQELEQFPQYNAWHTYYSEGYGWVVRTVENRGSVIAYVAVCFSCEALLPENLQDAIICIAGEDGIIYSNLPDLTYAQYLELYQQAVEGRIFKYNAKTYSAALLKSSLIRNGILAGISKHAVDGDITLLHNRFKALAAVCVLGILSVFILLYKRVIYPVLSLSENVLQNMGSGDLREVVSRTQSNFQRLQRQVSAMEKEKQMLIPLGVGELMYRLGTSSREGDMPRMGKRAMNLAGILEEQPYFVLGLFYQEDQDNIFRSMEQQVNKITPYWVLHNVMTDLLFQDRPGVLAPVDKYYFVIAACRPGEEKNQVQAIMQKCLDFYRDNYHVILAATSPVFSSGSINLRSSVVSVMKEIEYLHFWNLPNTTHSWEQDSDNLRRYFKAMRNMINRLDNEDYDGAFKIYRYIMDNCLPTGPANLQIAKYRLYGMIETLVSYFTDKTGQEENVVNLIDYEQRLHRANKFTEFQTETQAIFLELMEYSRQNISADNGVQRIEQVKQYIREHYRENDLSAATLTKQFRISTSYLSREFKRVEGMNLSDYIQRLRVEYAKQVLRTESVKNAAILCGYYDAQALSRAFKKIEGITPGEYKSNLGKEP